MNRPVQGRLLRVAVSQRVDRITARDECRDALDRRLVDWLLEVGMLTFPVPNGLESQRGLQPWLQALSPHAVVLSGGNDLGESPARDATEAALIDHAADFGLPMLGICRGMQMMAHRAGTALERVSGHAGTVHPLRTVKEVGLPEQVNSFHDWSLADCPDDYTILAEAPDGCVEAIRHRRHCWEGWMWHPERDTRFDAVTISRARALLHGNLLR